MGHHQYLVISKLLKSPYIFTSFVGVFVLLDQLIKLVVVQYFPGILFYNSDFAFGLPFPPIISGALVGLSLFVLLGILKTRWQTLPLLERAGFGLLLSGGLSNGLERWTRGSVVDYIYIGAGVFNLADFYVFIGLALLFWTTRSIVKVR